MFGRGGPLMTATMNQTVPTRILRRRPRRLGGRAAMAVASAAMLAVVLTGCLSDAQTRDVTLINQQRTSEKKSTVTDNQAAMVKAQAWSDHMARTGVLEHTGGGTTVNPSGVTGWCQYGENVGF